MPYVGDYNLTTTFHHRFTTVNGSGVPTTFGNTPSAQYYVDGGTTAFTAGLTLTADFNTVTGLNSLAVICTSSATGITSGVNVSVIVAAGTVSGISLVGYPILEYSITRRSPLRPATANRTVLISSTGYAAVDWAAVGSPDSSVSLSATTLFTTTNVTNNVGAVVTTINTIAPARITAQGIDVGAIVTAVNTITPARVTAQGIDIGAIVTAVNTITPARVTAQGIDVGAIVTAFNTIAPANVTSIQGGVTAATNLELAFDDTAGAVSWVGIVDQGTAQSATATTVVLRAAAAFADTTLVGAVITVLGSTQGYWQTRVINANTLADDTVTVDTFTVTPSGTITYKIFAGAPASASSLPPVNVTSWDGNDVTTYNVPVLVTAVSTIVPARITAQGIDIGAIVTAVNTITPARVTAQGIDIGAIVTAVSTIVPARVTAQGIDVGAIVTAVNTIAPARVTVVSASGLATFFLTNSGTTYAAATAGSVVKETADNAGGATLTATAVSAAVWDEDATGHQTQGTFGQTVGDSVADSTTLYAAVVTNASGASIAADITALSAIVTAMNAEVTATRAEVTATRAEVTAIRAKVTGLTFTSANRVDSNIKAVADVTVTGFGTVGNTWGP